MEAASKEAGFLDWGEHFSRDGTHCFEVQESEREHTARLPSEERRLASKP